MTKKSTQHSPILTAVHALISEASLHGEAVGAQGLMFAAAQQTMHLSEQDAFKALRDARVQLMAIQNPGGLHLSPTPFYKDLPDETLKVIWAALRSMTQDIHAPEHNLTNGEFSAAEQLFQAMDDEVNAREAAANGDKG